MTATTFLDNPDLSTDQTCVVGKVNEFMSLQDTLNPELSQPHTDTGTPDPVSSLHPFATSLDLEHFDPVVPLVDVLARF